MTSSTLRVFCVLSFSSVVSSEACTFVVVFTLLVFHLRAFCSGSAALRSRPHTSLVALTSRFMSLSCSRPYLMFAITALFRRGVDVVSKLSLHLAPSFDSHVLMPFVFQSGPRTPTVVVSTSLVCGSFCAFASLSSCYRVDPALS